MPALRPHLSRLLSMQIAASPSQRKFLERRFGSLDDDQLRRLESIASLIACLIDGREAELMSDYAWLCQAMLDEELYFRRHKRYRLSSFDDAFEKVYSDPTFMTRYMNGVLMTQLWWSNHSDALFYYLDEFLGKHPSGYAHLEIGPGHGLYLYFAAADPRASTVEGWDVSRTSIEATSQNLRSLDVSRAVTLRVNDMLSPSASAYSSIVLSEILEHVDDPGKALDHVRTLLSPGGRVFINVPVNSPAPDHIFNPGTPESLLDLVASHGYTIVDHVLYPATNQSLEVSRRKHMTISCVVIATNDRA
jgi:2-polyprenyl-3-methyl-5-hydroxy-6-metoxy-1,4-benzoquinol methylase